MKLQSVKKLVAFIMTIMMFSVLPGKSNAQQTGVANGQPGLVNAFTISCSVCSNSPPYVWCGCGFQCRNGRCRRVMPYYADPNHTNDVLSLSDSNPADFSLELTEAQYVSLKIYDATGRLIKTLADAEAPQAEHQFEWDKTDSGGNLVSPGLYILQLEADPWYAGTQKYFVIN